MTKMRQSLPADHPLYDYTELVLSGLAEVYLKVDVLCGMVYALCVFTFVLAIAFAAFAYQKYLQRHEIRELSAQCSATLTSTRDLLTAVRGWTVVHTSSVDRTAAEVKDKIVEVTDTAVQRVVEAVQNVAPQAPEKAP